MKVLITTDSYLPTISGVVTSVANLMVGLEKKDIDIRVLTLSHTSESHCEGNIYFIGSRETNIYPDIRASFSLRDSLLDELMDWKPDIIHTQCEFFTFTYAKKIAKFCNCPIVHTFHTFYEDVVSYVLPFSFGSKFVAPVMSRRLKGVSVVIAPTSKAKEYLERSGITSEIQIVPSGIDLKGFSRELSASQRKMLISELGFPEGAQIVGSVGRLAHEKNYEEVIEAFKVLHKKDSNLYLLLVGDGPHRNDLEEYSKELGVFKYIRFAGRVDVDQTYKYYKLMDVFVSASSFETQGLTYIEALASGTPVVARKDDAIVDVITDGENGYQYVTVEEMVEKISSLLLDSSKLKRFRENALESSQKYNNTVFGEKVYSIYSKVTGQT